MLSEKGASFGSLFSFDHFEEMRNDIDNQNMQI